MNTLLLENQFVSLRPYKEEHIEKTVEWLSKPLIQENFGFQKEITVELHQNWLAKNQDVLKWAIYAHHYVGNLFLFEKLQHKSGYFQIYIGSDQHLGKKIGFHALRLMLNHAFNDRNLHRIWMHCFPSNERAIRLYEKLGFVFEGFERESISIDGKYISQGRWSMLKNEWFARS